MGPNISAGGNLASRVPVRPSPPVGAHPFALGVEELGTTVYLRLTGEVDAAHSERVETELERVRKTQATRVVFDLRDVTFLDSTTLRAILRADERGRSAGFDVVVVRPRGFANRVFTLTRAGERLDLVDGLSQTRADSARGSDRRDRY